ncbi:MAG: TlpA family protein disulfide reductase [Thermodesulfobacteriota bacterium]
MKSLRTALLALAVLLFAAPSAHAQAKEAPLVTGQDILKAVIQARGKVVVINFWASWCGPCRQEIPELMELRKHFPEDKLTIIGVSLDQEPAMYAAFVARAGFNYPVHRAAPDVTPAFSIRAIPRTVVYSPKGELAHTQEGYMPGPDLERLVKKLLGG